VRKRTDPLPRIPSSCPHASPLRPAIWSDCVDPVRPGSYPLFFWCQRLLQPGTTIIDYGGSVGLTFYGYHRYARLPQGATWTVVELPLIVAQGRRIAQREGARNAAYE
jgi:putative methyltransferase (TIGR04325 family)